jgi:hypothetical protein
VPAGDTLCAAARRHGTDPATLRELNGLIASDSLLRAGQQLRVPRTLPRGCASTTRGGPRVRCGDRLVVVREGDTLWDLARVLRVPVDHLVAVNGGAPQQPSPPRSSRPSPAVCPVGFGFQPGGEQQSVATPQAARG